MEVPWRGSWIGEAFETRQLHYRSRYLERRRAAGFSKLLLPRASIIIWMHSDWVGSWLVYLHQRICVPMQRGMRNTVLKGAQMLRHHPFLPEPHHISASGSQLTQAAGTWHQPG